MTEEALRELLELRRGKRIPNVLFENWHESYGPSASEYASARSLSDLVSTLEGRDALQDLDKELTRYDKEVSAEAGALRGGKRPTPPTRNVRDEQVRYEPADQRIISALSEYYASLAAEDADVQVFRQKVLRGQPLSKWEWERNLRYILDRGSHGRLTGDAREAARSHYMEAIPKPSDIPLTDSEAFALLESPATQHMSAEQFREWGIPVVGHEVQEGLPRGVFGRSDFGEGCHSLKTLTFQPSGETYIVRVGRPVIEVDGFKLIAGKAGRPFPAQKWRAETTEDAALAVQVRHPEFAKEHGWVIEPKEAEPFEAIRARIEDDSLVAVTHREENVDTQHELHYWGRRGHGTTVRVWPGSVLDNLRRIAVALAKRYHWDERDAVWFVLAGGTPCLRALHVRTTTVGGGEFTDAYLSLDVLPWVSRRTVEALYHNTQKRLFGRVHKRYPKRKRHVRGPQTDVEVFAFVTREAGANPPSGGSEWRALREQWNAASQDASQQFADTGTFHKYYDRARKSLLGRDYAGAQLRAQKMEQSGDSEE